jgi:hypothetical protein
VVLQLNGGRAPYAWLLKILYLVDVHFIEQVGDPSGISGIVYDCLRSRVAPALWSDFVTQEADDIVLLSPPGDSELSDFDVETLESIVAEYPEGAPA